MDIESLHAKLLQASAAIQAVLEELATPTDAAAIHTAAATFPGNLIPAAELYRRVKEQNPYLTRRKAAFLLTAAGYVWVRRQQGNFWVRP